MLCSFDNDLGATPHRDQTGRAWWAAGFSSPERVRIGRIQQFGDPGDLGRRDQIRHDTADLDALRFDRAPFELFGETADHSRHQQQPPDQFVPHNFCQMSLIEPVDHDDLSTRHQGAERVLHRSHMIER